MQVLQALRKIEERGVLETARRSLQTAGQIFRYAVASGYLESDPSRDLKGALSTPKVKHHSAITEPKEIGQLMAAIDNYQGTEIVRCLIAITPYLFQRPGEIRQMEWKEINFQESLWEIPANKMKMDEPHIVPLSRQAISILKYIHGLTGNGLYVFQGQRHRDTPASDNTVNKALRKMGYSREVMTAHGFRAMARTVLDEVLEVDLKLVEQQLSHEVRDPLGRAYNRTKHLPQRKEMMQQWADYLDSLKAEALNENVIMGAFKKTV